jgi:hypothetical protein
MDRIDQISQGPDQSKATIDRAEHAMHASPYVSYNWRRGQVDRHVWVRCAVDVVVVVVVVVFILRPLFSPPFLLSLSWTSRVCSSPLASLVVCTHTSKGALRGSTPITAASIKLGQISHLQ